MLNRAEQVDQGTPKAIDRPGHDNIESPAACILEHSVETGTLCPTFRTTDAGIGIGLHYFPATPLGADLLAGSDVPYKSPSGDFIKDCIAFAT
jgi:hypothetical protein